MIRVLKKLNDQSKEFNDKIFDIEFKIGSLLQ